MSKCEASERTAPVTVKAGANPVLLLQSEVNKLFQDFFGETVPHFWHAAVTPFSANPAIDVSETDEAYKITAEIPGLDAKDISVTVSGQHVTIKGEKRNECKEEKNGYFRQERSYGAFQRMIALPHELANTAKAEASISKGILTITVPKQADAAAKTRKLDIQQAA